MEIRYRQHVITLDDDDADLATRKWRVHLVFGRKYAVRSVPRDILDLKMTGNQYLHRLIAQRAGIGLARRVGFADGNGLNLRRSNLVDMGRESGNLGTGHCRGIPKQQPRQPAGMRRRKLGTNRPAGVYEIELAWPDPDADGGIRWEAAGTCERVRVRGSQRTYWAGTVYEQPGVLRERFPARPSFRLAAADVLALVPGWPPSEDASAAA